MTPSRKTVAFMPLRGGSKSIPYKNICLIAGKPLFFWSLKSAFESEVFDQVFVSTEDDRIADMVSEYFPSARIVRRPAEFATDEASTESAMLHFCGLEDFDVVSLIQATSPLTLGEDFRAAWAKFTAEGLDSLVTGVEWKRFFWTRDGKPVNYDPQNRPRRQEMDGWLMENGAFYFTKRSILEQCRCRLGGKIGVYEMDPANALEIDEPSDWLMIESMLDRRTGSPSGRGGLKNVKALVVDVDGTLTDGGMYYGDAGEAFKKFNTKDAQGMKLVEQSGIMVCVITSENSPSVRSRMAKLAIDEYHSGVADKLPLLKDLCRKWNIALENVAYVGDDIGDIECIRAAGFSACPADGESAVRRAATFVTRRKGGHGAVREVCEMILEAVGSP